MIRTDRTVHILLAVIAFLLGANLLVQSHQDRIAAAAGLPDTGAQLQAQIDSLNDISKKMDKLQGYLESGKMVVVVKDEKPAK